MQLLHPRNLLVLACILGSALGSTTRAAESDAKPAVTISGAWARWLPGGLPCAGYLTLHNTGSTDIALTGASCPDFARVMLHESYTTESGTNRMRHIDSLPIAAGGTAELQPGGYHIMLMRPKHELKPGDVITVTLLFADGSALPVDLPLKPAGTVK